MITRRALRPPVPGAPEMMILSAAGEDEQELRAAARELSAATAGLRVSRSYRHPHALLAWHPHAVGVDLERVGGADPRFLASILTPQERLRAPDPGDAALTYSLWSSKEALAKALGDALSFDPRRLDSPAFWPGGRAGPWRAAQLDDLPARHTGWICWRES